MIQKWLQEKEELKSQARFVRSNKELQKLNASKTDYLFGLFGETHIRFGDARVPDEDPTVEDMTTKAIEVDILNTSS